MIKAVVFDVDGVIVVNKEIFSEMYSRKNGIPAHELTPFFTGPFQDCLTGKADLKTILKTEIHRFKHSGSIDEFLDIWFKSEHNIAEDVVELVKSLKQKGLIVAIATNQEEYRTKYIEENMGLGQHFQHIFSSARIGHMKPSRDFFAHVQKSLGVKPQEILFIDDSEANVKGAKDFGMNAHFYTDLETCKKVVYSFL